MANSVLTQRWGAVGAAWALLLSSGLFSAMYLLAGHYAHPLNLEWGRLGALASGSVHGHGGVVHISHIGIKAALFGSCWFGW